MAPGPTSSASADGFFSSYLQVYISVLVSRSAGTGDWTAKGGMERGSGRGRGSFIWDGWSGCFRLPKFLPTLVHIDGSDSSPGPSPGEGNARTPAPPDGTDCLQRCPLTHVRHSQPHAVKNRSPAPFSPSFGFFPKSPARGGRKSRGLGIRSGPESHELVCSS